MPALVSGLYETVYYIGVDRILGTVHRKRLIPDSPVIALVPGADSDPLHPVLHLARLLETASVSHAESEPGHRFRDGHPDIVREYGRELVTVVKNGRPAA